MKYVVHLQNGDGDLLFKKEVESMDSKLALDKVISAHNNRPGSTSFLKARSRSVEAIYHVTVPCDILPISDSVKR